MVFMVCDVIVTKCQCGVIRRMDVFSVDLISCACSDQQKQNKTLRDDDTSLERSCSMVAQGSRVYRQCTREIKPTMLLVLRKEVQRRATVFFSLRVDVYYRRFEK